MVYVFLARKAESFLCFRICTLASPTIGIVHPESEVCAVILMCAESHAVIRGMVIESL